MNVCFPLWSVVVNEVLNDSCNCTYQISSVADLVRFGFALIMVVITMCLGIRFSYWMLKKWFI